MIVEFLRRELHADRRSQPILRVVVFEQRLLQRGEPNVGGEQVGVLQQIVDALWVGVPLVLDQVA